MFSKCSYKRGLWRLVRQGFIYIRSKKKCTVFQRIKFTSMPLSISRFFFFRNVRTKRSMTPSNTGFHIYHFERQEYNFRTHHIPPQTVLIFKSNNNYYNYYLYQSVIIFIVPHQKYMDIIAPSHSSGIPWSRYTGVPPFHSPLNNSNWCTRCSSHLWAKNGLRSFEDRYLISSTRKWASMPAWVSPLLKSYSASLPVSLVGVISAQFFLLQNHIFVANDPLSFKNPLVQFWTEFWYIITVNSIHWIGKTHVMYE